MLKIEITYGDISGFPSDRAYETPNSGVSTVGDPY
jgi:hypothetical protein